MPVKNYGVWVGTPTRYKAETNAEDSRSPHLSLWYKDGSGGEKRAAINIKSISSDSRLVYWVNSDFQHPITASLRELDPGFHFIPDRDGSNEGLAVDYIRGSPKFLELTDGRLLPHDIPGPNNDILDELLPLVKRAVADRSNKVYIFGSSFGTGIHDVHMNQGSLPRFDNGVGQDGALLFYVAAKQGFEAVFLAFASQQVPTDDETGLALEDSQPLSDLASLALPGGG